MFLPLLVALVQPSFANVIHVTTLTDKIGGGGGCSLKEAIYSSTLHDSFDGVHGMAIDTTIPDHFITTDCELGSGSDTIILPTGYPLPTFRMTSDTIHDAYNPYGPTATPIINSHITIEGYGATLQSSGTANVRLFAVGPATIKTPNGTSSGTGSLTLINVHITQFRAKGGDGADGGGGGLGAGGAIYVQNGNLTIENCTFDGSVATGGLGGNPAFSLGSNAGGGGGGLGGNGGTGSNGVGGGSGGGGGGSRGNGGNAVGGGGGGGGTVINGDNTTSSPLGGPGGYLCGGDGGGVSNNGNSGDNGRCPGGGGGGGGNFTSGLIVQNDNGANGAYGGGGGGGNNGGNGGFGGGGGAAATSLNSNLINGTAGGNGGFGGGGGAGYKAPASIGAGPGQGGAFGGNGDLLGGGGGGALGGAIFSDGAVLTIKNSTFANISLFDGLGGSYQGGRANNGAAAGAIFARDGSVTIIDSTISGNQADGSGAGLVVYGDSSSSLTLENTIIAGNGANECYVRGSVTAAGAGNLITSNGSGAFSPCPGVVATADPQLGPLQLNSPGLTPTMAIPITSSAFNAANASTSLSTDQRGVDRPQDGGYDIGAYEACPPPRVFGEITCVILVNAPPANTQTLNMAASPAGTGATQPPLGANTVLAGALVSLQATANPGYSFVNWTGNVTNPTSPSTTILMTADEVSVTANFALCECEVGGEFGVVRGGYVYNFSTSRYSQTITLRNNSPLTVTGPISLILDSLSSNATLLNVTGYTDSLLPPSGSPYINTSITLAPAQSVSFTLTFANPTKKPISYNTRVVTGTGPR